MLSILGYINHWEKHHTKQSLAEKSLHFRLGLKTYLSATTKMFMKIKKTSRSTQQLMISIHLMDMKKPLMRHHARIIMVSKLLFILKQDKYF